MIIIHKSSVEWSDKIWNPCTGCTRLCRDEQGRIYCFAYYFALRLAGRCGYDKEHPFKPTFRPERLHEPSRLKKPSKIFTCSMGDLFDPSIKAEWKSQIFLEMIENPRHSFQVLTKRPVEAVEWGVFPRNCWIGTSVDGIHAKSDMIRHLRAVQARIRFVSFEPLLGRIEGLNLKGIQWVIIGARTGSRASQPEKEWVKDIIAEARKYHIPIFMKNNLNLVPRIQEYPREGWRI